LERGGIIIDGNIDEQIIIKPRHIVEQIKARQ
jgi:hypothetical protein